MTNRTPNKFMRNSRNGVSEAHRKRRLRHHTSTHTSLHHNIQIRNNIAINRIIR